MRQSVDASLRRLGHRCIDALLVHEPVAPLEEHTVSALAAVAGELRRDGRIRRFGIAGPLSMIANAEPFESVEIFQAPFADALKLAPRTSRAVIAYGTFAAFRAQGATHDTFQGMVRSALDQHPNLDVIVSSTRMNIVRGFAKITGG
jgi:aryl-alcohol dehydrogenase-like predicted oxidoreductase